VNKEKTIDLLLYKTNIFDINSLNKQADIQTKLVPCINNNNKVYIGIMVGSWYTFYPE